MESLCPVEPDSIGPSDKIFVLKKLYKFTDGKVAIIVLPYKGLKRENIIFYG